MNESWVLFKDCPAGTLELELSTMSHALRDVEMMKVAMRKLVTMTKVAESIP